MFETPNLKSAFYILSYLDYRVYAEDQFSRLKTLSLIGYYPIVI
jgi:hypothetical protein